MRRILKDHFIPHEGNAYQPLFLRFRIAFGLLLFVLLLEGSYLLGTTYVLPKSANFAAIFASVLVEQTNEERIKESLGGLTVNPKLELAAKMKAEDMAQKGYFAHNSPDGKTPWYFIREAGYEYAAAGENLAVNFTDSRDVTEAWMRSPTHRANIMNGNYTEIGIATAMGTYKGKSAIFVVQEFGRPSVIARDIPQATSSLVALVNRVTAPDVAVPAVRGESTLTLPTPSLREVSPPPPQFVRTETLGEESTKLAVADTVEVPTLPTAVTPPATTSVASASPALPELTPPLTPSVVETVIAAPRTATAMVFAFLVALLIIALGLAIFIQIRIQHPHMIANTLLLVAVIVIIMLLNVALGQVRGAI